MKCQHGERPWGDWLFKQAFAEVSRGLDRLCVPSKAGQGRGPRRSTEREERAYASVYTRGLIRRGGPCSLENLSLRHLKNAALRFRVISIWRRALRYAARKKKKKKKWAQPYHYTHFYSHFLRPRVSYLHFPADATQSKTLGNRCVFFFLREGRAKRKRGKRIEREEEEDETPSNREGRTLIINTTNVNCELCIRGIGNCLLQTDSSGSCKVALVDQIKMFQCYNVSEIESVFAAEIQMLQVQMK